MSKGKLLFRQNEEGNWNWTITASNLRGRSGKIHCPRWLARPGRGFCMRDEVVLLGMWKDWRDSQIKQAGLEKDEAECEPLPRSLPKTNFLCEVTQLSLLRQQEALQTAFFLALCHWQGRFIRLGEEQWPACYLFMISSNMLCTW